MDPSINAFQQKLLSAVSDDTVSTDSFVALRLGQEGWLIDLSHLKEASVPSKIARHAQAPSWIVGISNFKGEVWTIVDMLVLIKNQKTVNPHWGWVTLLRGNDDTGSADNHLGLLWTEIVEIAPKEEYDVHPHPSEKYCKAHYKDKKGVLWRELDIGQVLGHSSFAA